MSFFFDNFELVFHFYDPRNIYLSEQREIRKNILFITDYCVYGSKQRYMRQNALTKVQDFEKLKYIFFSI